MTATKLDLEVVLERLPLKAPFRISGYTFTEVPVAVVTLRRGRCVGRGEAAGVYYLEDSPERMVAAIEKGRRDIEAGITREQLLAHWPIGGARNALDCALWDLEAQEQGQPVWKLAGLSAVRPLLTTFTLGADDPATMVAGARAAQQARALKLKLSGDAPLDAERVRAVRAARPDVWLGVDANQGFSLASLQELLPTLLEARVELIEQPLPRGKEAELADFECPIPLAADESVQGLADVDKALGRFDVVNIKLDKCGGLTEALLMVEEARHWGLKVMVGNMVGSSLAMAPAFVIGQHCDVVDLDGPTFLASDRPPTIRYDEDGRIWCDEVVWGGPKPGAA